ncbi:MAG: transposase [Lysobacteraceae bacterium]|nr:MAG: transposase [Nitrospiraceae bacterium]GIX34294.1 MAG: transposase [Xanthomonadaceae bacterium]
MKKRFTGEPIIGFLREADARLLKDLEAENNRLKRLLAEPMSEDDVIKYAPRKQW